MAALALLSSATMPTLWAQNATWAGVSEDFNLATNWDPATAIPTGTASFSGEGVTALTVLDNTNISSLAFSGAVSYTISGGWFAGGSGSTVVLMNVGVAPQTVSSALSSSARSVNFQNFLSNNSASDLTLGDVRANVVPEGLVYAFTPRGNGLGRVIINGVISDKAEGSLNLGRAALFRTGGSAITSPLVLNGANTYSGGTFYGGGTGPIILGNSKAFGTGLVQTFGGGINLSANTPLIGVNAIANPIRLNAALTSVTTSSAITAMAVGSNVITLADPSGLAVGMLVNYIGGGFGIPVPYGTKITEISGNNITLSNPVPMGVTATTVTAGGSRFGTFGNSSQTVNFTGSQDMEFSGSFILGTENGSNVTANHTFNVTNTGLTILSGSLGQDVGFPGGFTKTGPGTLILKGVNSYTAATNVNAGVLRIDGTQSATGTVNVNTGGTLTGVGSIGGTTNVNAGGFLAPSLGASTFSIGTNLVLNATATTTLQIDGSTRGSGYAAINVTNNATLGGTLNLVFDTTLPGGTTLDLFNVGGAVTGGFANISVSGSYTGTLVSGEPLVVGSQTLTFDQTTGDLLIAGGAPASPIAVWRSENFTSGELNDPALEASIWGNLADPDTDGYNNLLEYALGGNPRTASSSIAPIVTRSVGGELQISFVRARAELTYRVQWSDTLDTWNLLQENPGVVGEVVTVTDPTSVGQPRRFLRVVAVSSE